MSTLRIRAAIVGIGETPVSRNPCSAKSDLQLQLEACIAAIADAGLCASDIDGLVAPIMGGVAEDFSANLGLDLRFAVTSHTGGAAAVAGLASAAMAVAFGMANYVLVPAGWCGFSRGKGLPVALACSGALGAAEVVRNFYHPSGAVGAPQQYALVATRYVERYGITAEQTGAVALAMRRHAQRNEGAVMHGRPLTLEDYLASPMISSPFRRLDCALRTDGAAAVIVTSRDRAADLPQHSVPILGVREARPQPIDDLAGRSDLLQTGVTKAAEGAFHMAGARPSDIDFLQTYDSFTVNVLRQIEEAGFCPRGEAGRFVAEGAIDPGGRLPVNTHGGMLSAGDVQGMNHVVEAVRQLRGSAGARQLAAARLGMVIGMGGGWGTAAAAVLASEAVE